MNRITQIKTHPYPLIRQQLRSFGGQARRGKTQQFLVELGMAQINYDDFAKVEFKIGEIKEATGVEGSEKLLKLKVDFGEENLRIVFSGIKKWYSPTDLINKKTVFVTNIKPRKIMGEESQAMIFGASAFVKTMADKEDEGEENMSVLFLDKDLPVGSKVF